MTNQAYAGILILFVVSLLVRVLPAVTKLPFSKEATNNIKRFLPVAVFINLSVYCFSSEFQKHPVAATVGFGLMTLLLLFKRVHLLVIVGLASVTYFWLMGHLSI
jgi:branched-subunit amino acid transport protein AzlD